MSSDRKPQPQQSTITRTKVNNSTNAPILERRLPVSSSSSTTLSSASSSTTTNNDPSAPITTTKKKRKNDATTAVSAASARALTTQALTFYFRYPVKAFFRQRIDYLQVARAINPRVLANEPWSLRTSTLGLLTHAVRTKGWKFIPQQVLPPMFANAGIGALLYTSYLQILQRNYSAAREERMYPPPGVGLTFTAGMISGAVQSLVAAPLDALTVRFDVRHMLDGQYTSMTNYAHHKLKEIGIRGVFSGSVLSLTKDSLGYGLFFCSFEYIKQQAYYNFLSHYYGSSITSQTHFHPYRRIHHDNIDELPLIRPHWALEPSFLLLAGATASFVSSSIFHPLTRVQNIHYSRLETIDYAKSTIPDFVIANRPLKHSNSLFSPVLVDKIWHQVQKGWVFKNLVAYRDTFRDCQRLARKQGWRRWLYAKYWASTIRQTPSTSVALIVFELMRRKFGEESGEMSIVHDGFRILL